MSRLVPPLIPPGAQPAIVVVVVPLSGVSRDEYLKQYQRSMREPLPESKSLQGELCGWSGALGKRRWVGERYSPSVALLMCSRRVEVADLDTIDRLGAVCRDTIGPLSCYSAGWYSSLAPLVPSGLRRSIGAAVREARRAAVRKVRGAMVRSEPSVDESFDTVQNFVETPISRAGVDEKVALDGFVSAIVRLLDAGAAGSTILTEEETTVLAELGERVVDDFGAEPEEPLTAERRAELRTTAITFVERVIADRVKGKDRSDPRLSEAFERVVTTYVNRLHRGKPLEGTEYYLKLRLDAVRLDEKRRTAVRRLHERRLIVADDPDRSQADDRVENTPDPAADAANELLAVIAATIAEDPDQQIDGKLCWEGRTAITLLTIGGTLDIASPGEVRRVAAQLWRSEQPADARSESAMKAGMNVYLTLETAGRRARRSLADTLDAGVVS
ncbi:hypothetical protein [Gordonia alkanivorans]|uniref:hypothetical protein n=1 Tax=Gordonia alkanivorans TaxID=84096 RepID=UPI0012F4B3D1|nr:hypothetical protein [Gordonia alkanivorans]